MNDELKYNSAHIGWIKKDNVELTDFIQLKWLCKVDWHLDEVILIYIHIHKI